MPDDTAAPTTPPALSATERAVKALADVIERSTTPEMLRSRQVLGRRMALSGGRAEPRMPPPLNITEVGGYINLLEKMGDRGTIGQLVSAALGVAGPVSPDENDPFTAPPALSFTELANHRPTAGPALATTPLLVRIRSDFAPALSAALASIARAGCTLPLVNIPAALQPPGVPAPTDLLALIGRAVMIVPEAALKSPDKDPVVIGRPAPGGNAAGDLRILLRQDPAVGVAAAVQAASFSVVEPAANGAFSEAVRQLKLLDPAGQLAAAGWVAARPIALNSIGADASWARLHNITGLIPGVTRLRDELLNLHTAAAITASNVSALADRVWDGAAFRAA